MTEIRLMVACLECGSYWAADADPACTQVGHRRQQFEQHRHCSPVVLPDGTPVTAVSFDPADPYRRDHVPDYGLYLDPRWSPPWPHDHLQWPDFGVPANPAELVQALTSLLHRAKAGEKVEVGCLGGHGRTGTALSCLAVLSGQPAADAVPWVRANYCGQAVETAAQESFVAALQA